ncbi:protein phosphatase [Lachnospiraceae bacterium XBB2008]|nr:protein phosphatase [Lachnospiraceae bacterium XBB2008]
MIRYEHYTDKGLSSQINQDAVFCETNDNTAVFCVADGMGGHMHGEQASNAIVEAIGAWYRENVYENAGVEFCRLLQGLETILSNVNSKIFEEMNTDGLCGSTAVVLIISKDRYAVYSAGDSRVYLKRGFSFSQLTVDDVWQNKPEIHNHMDMNDIANNENYGKLTKAVGIKNHIVFNRITGEIRKRDIFFLCCDGVYKYIADRKLKRLFTSSKKICDEVRKAGAPDNFSFIIVRT